MNNQKNNSGALFKNNKTKDGQPDYTGTIIIDLKEYRISGWVNKSKSGMSYLRLLLNEIVAQPINEQTHPTTITPNTGTQTDEIVNDLPF